MTVDPACPDPADQLLTERELAARWGFSASTLATQRSQGRGIPFVRLASRSIRYRLADVLAAEQYVQPQVQR